jgi:hypothetical protein
LDQYPLGPLNRIVMMGSWAYHQQGGPHNNRDLC